MDFFFFTRVHVSQKINQHVGLHVGLHVGITWYYGKDMIS